MWAAVVFFAFTAAQDPVRIGIVVLLISRPHPLRNVSCNGWGLMITGFGAALAALFLLHDVLLPVTRAVNSASESPVVPPIQDRAWCACPVDRCDARCTVVSASGRVRTETRRRLVSPCCPRENARSIDNAHGAIVVDRACSRADLWGWRLSPDFARRHR